MTRRYTLIDNYKLLVFDGGVATFFAHLWDDWRGSVLILLPAGKIVSRFTT